MNTEQGELMSDPLLLRELDNMEKVTCPSFMEEQRWRRLLAMARAFHTQAAEIERLKGERDELRGRLSYYQDLADSWFKNAQGQAND